MDKLLDEKTPIKQLLTCRSCCLQKTKEKLKSLNTELAIDATIFDIPPNTSVLNLYTYCTKLPADLDDAMPQSVCTECIKKLLAAYEFLKECESTAAKLTAEAVVAEMVVDNYVSELNFDDIITMDVKQEGKSKHETLSPEAEIDIADDELKESLAGYEFLNSNSSPAIPEDPAEEYLDPEYLEDENPDTEYVVCGNCDMLMLQKDYAEHFAQMHTNARCENNVVTIQQKDKVFKCTAEGCDKEFFLDKSLRTHRQKAHERSFLCPVCGINCVNRRALYDHERNHDGFNEKSKRRADCKVCGMSITVKDMKVHLRRHTGERPYTCNTCDKTFRQCSTLRTHELMHLKQRPFPCTVCDKTFARAAILKIHFRTHTGEKPFACASCPNKYSRRHLLVNHERKHTGSKPYVCDVCGKRFKNLAFMKEHRFSHNANQLKCEECAAVFTYPRQLRKHLKEQHSEVDC